MCDDHSHSCGHSAVVSVCQNLAELDFERGIWSAALNGDIIKVEVLLKSGTDPSMCDSSGYTALHYAARNGQKAVCLLLLKRGANPNKQTPGGATPMHRAAFMGHSDIIKLLFQYKANALLCDSDRKSPLHKALERKQFDTALILIETCPQLKQLEDKDGLTAAQYVKDEGRRKFFE